MKKMSLNNPLRIAEIECGSAGGRIGITLCPGKKGPSTFGGHHDRDLPTDLDIIAEWNAAAVVTLVEQFELDHLQVPDLGKEVERRFMEWHHWPIKDVSVPDAVFETHWPERSARLRTLLDSGARVLIHCRGGIGRAGMIAARLLVDKGIAPREAMKKVRAVRPRAIETDE